MTGKLPIIQLAGKTYILVKRIDTGHMSVVWKAGVLNTMPEYPNCENIRKVGSELVAYLREKPSPNVEIHNQIRPTSWVALKVAKATMEKDLQEEAKVLRTFRDDAWHRPGQAQIVRLLEDLTPEIPVIIFEWVEGVQLDRLPEPMSEQDGLFFADQLAALIRLCAAAPYRIVLTDTLKPNSLFWKSAEDSLVLIDWNVLGKPADFRPRTLPIVGNTLHTMLVGEQVDWENVNPDEVGKPPAWAMLTYGTMALVRRALLADFSGRNPSELARQLSEAIKEQWGLWDETAETLLAQARSEHGEEAVRRYDVARAKLERQGHTLPEKDARRMLHELKETLVAFGEQQQYPAALINLSWARKRYPDERELRWAWLTYRTAYENRSQAEIASEALSALRRGTYEEAVKILPKDGGGSKHLQALLKEAYVWHTLEEEDLSRVEKAYEGLSNLWRGSWQTDQAISDVQQAVSSLQRRTGDIAGLKHQLMLALEGDDVSRALKFTRELLELKPDDMPDLPRLAKALEALEQDAYEKALQALPSSDRDTPSVKRASSQAVLIRRITLERLEERAERACSTDCYKAAVRDAQILARHDQRQKQRLHEYQEKQQTYEKLQAEARNSLTPQEELDAYDRWIQSGFLYDTDGHHPDPERNLVKLRLKRTLDWANGLAARQQYTEAISLLRDRALSSLKTPQTLNARRKIPDIQKEKIERLAEQTEQKIKEYKQQQQRAIKKWLDNIKQRSYEEGESLDDYLISVNNFIHKARNIDSHNRDVQEAQRALEALQDGRIALKNNVLNEAAEKLRLAERYSWPNLKSWITPYREVADIQQRVDFPEADSFEPHEWVERIVAYDQACQDLAYICSYDTKRFDPWLNQRLEALKSDTPKRLHETKETFDVFVKEWLERWKQLTSGGNALAHQPLYQEVLKALDSGKERVASRSEDISSSFDRWIDQIKQRCGMDMTQALLLQGYAYHQNERPDLAKKVMREAEQIFANIPKQRLAKETLYPEIVNLLSWHWLQAFSSSNVPESLAHVPKKVKDHLAGLINAYLQPPTKEDKAQFLHVLAKTPNPRDLAQQLANYEPNSIWDVLKRALERYTYDTVANKVKDGKCQEAEKILQGIQSLHTDTDPKPMIEALEDKLQEIWLQHLQAHKETLWLEGLDAAYEEFNALDEAHATLNQHLLSQPTETLAKQIDKIIKAEAGVLELAQVLASYTPEASRSLLYQPERAVALIESGSYHQALNVLQRTETMNDVKGLTQAIRSKIAAYCEHVFDDLKDVRGEELAQKLSKGLANIDKQLGHLAQRYLPLKAKDISGLSEQMIDALIEQDKMQFVAAMSAVPVAQWNTTLRNYLRWAYAARYREEAERLVDRGRLKAAFIWLARPAVKRRIRSLERTAITFDRLSSQAPSIYYEES